MGRPLRGLTIVCGVVLAWFSATALHAEDLESDSATSCANVMSAENVSASTGVGNLTPPNESGPTRVGISFRVLELRDIDPVRGSYYFRGQAFLELGQYTEAVADLSQTLDLDPQNIGAYYFRGLAYRDMEQFPEAIADFSQTLEFDPGSALSNYYRGLTHEDLGENEKAIADYQSVLEKSTNEALTEAAKTLLAFLGVTA